MYYEPFSCEKVDCNCIAHLEQPVTLWGSLSIQLVETDHVPLSQGLICTHPIYCFLCRHLTVIVACTAGNIFLSRCTCSKSNAVLLISVCQQCRRIGGSLKYHYYHVWFMHNVEVLYGSRGCHFKAKSA